MSCGGCHAIVDYLYPRTLSVMKSVYVSTMRRRVSWLRNRNGYRGSPCVRNGCHEASAGGWAEAVPTSIFGRLWGDQVTVP